MSSLYARPLRQVSLRHRRLVALFLAGESVEDIALATGYSESWVRGVLRNPSIEAYVKEGLAEQDNRLRALAPLVVNGIRDALKSNDYKVVIAAATLWMKSQGKLTQDDVPTQSAEDIARQLIKIRTPDGTEITVGQELRS